MEALAMGQKFMPLPEFSPENPYWFDPAKRWGFLLPQYRPRPTAQDFLYASTWEIMHTDVRATNMIRVGLQTIVALTWKQAVKNQIRTMLSKQKEIDRNAKTA